MVVSLPAGDEIRHAGGLSAARGFLSKHGFTFTSFTVIGAFVFATGIAGLYVQVHWLGIDPRLAYALQAIVSITLNFTLNWAWTWRQREVGWWHGFRRFLVTRIVTFPAHQITYNLLIWANVQFLAASFVTTALLTVVTYWFSDSWVFVAKRPVTPLEEEQ